MGKPFWRSVEYFFTGNYSADEGNNNIFAIGFGGEIHAYGGDDTVTVGSIGASVYTGSGNDTVQGGAAYLKVEDSSGNLVVKGAAGYADINKNGDGNVDFAGIAGGASIDHTGNHGYVQYVGAAAYNGLTRKGLTGNMTFEGAGGYNEIWHETNQGNLDFTGAGGGNKLDRTWFNRYQGSSGYICFNGVGAANSISSRVETGNIDFKGAGADNHIVRKGKIGYIILKGAGASNRIERTRQAEDIYSETRGDIRFEGIGGYNSIYSDVAHGNINFSGGGAYNEITRKGSGNDFEGEGLANANADDIVLTNAVMSGSWIGYNKKVTAIKSTREPNTYLFAFADSSYTKINKVQLRNDPQTGLLKYYSTAWDKQGNLLNSLANQDISSRGGFNAININGAYTLSDLAVEHQQSVTVHAVEKNLTEYNWVTYANGAKIDAADVTLSDAKMGGPAISADGSTVDVQAVKSNRHPNTYIYAKMLGPYTKIVVVELANDPQTGVLKYKAMPWYKTGNYTSNIANEDISAANGYRHAGYSLSDLQYSVNVVRSSSERVAEIDEYSEQALIKPATDSGESSGDVRFNGAGGGNVIQSNVTRGNVYFDGAGAANVITHSSKFGNTEFNGAGLGNVIVKSGQQGDLTFNGAGAVNVLTHSSEFGNTEFNGAGLGNVIVKSGQQGDLTFNGVGLANVLVHQSKQGKMDVYAGGAVNVLVRIGDGQYLAHLLAYGNISVHKGNGDSRVVMFGGYNTHTQIGNGSGTWLAAGGFNVMTQVGSGDIASVLVGGANVLTKIGDGDLISGMLGGANVITHISSDSGSSDTISVALGGLNVLTKKGKGNALAVMGGGGNVLTHIGDGNTTGVMIGGANVLTKVGNGDATGVMLGIGNVLTHVGNGQTLGVMGAVGNVFTKVGDGTAIAAMIGAANIFTHVGEGDSWALMGGLGNVFTKVGNGNALALMVAEVNVFTHIGDGTTVALMLAKGNIATKIGNGTTIAAMVGNANILTHIGDGDTFAAMIGQANILTKVGNDLTAALMVGQANIYTHVGDGTSIGIFAGEANIMTKVGDGTTLAAMFGKANIMTHVGDGLTGVLALGQANIVTKVGDGFMGVVAAAKANVVTHVGDATTAAVLLGEGNILTKVGEGTTVGLLISKIGNIMTHVGDGMTIGVAKGKANIITKVGDGLGVNVAWGEANILTHVGDGERYNFAKGKANIITKVGDGQEVSVVQGKANIITHVGDGDDYTGAWGEANIITKVGDGRNVVLAKGKANIVTQVGDGDSFTALWSKGNIVTKVGDGMQVTAAKGNANIVTTVGNGLSVTATYGDLNINTKVGDGISVNVAWGKYNINTKVGDGLNVAVMKGKANLNVHVGDGLGINASYAQNNVAIKIGNGDFYSLSVASSNTKSNKLSSLFDNIKQTVLGMAGSQGINFLVHGDDASSSGSRQGRGAIATPEITKLNGFQMEEIAEIDSDLGDSLTGGVTDVETPDVAVMQSELNVDEDAQSIENPNLIANGDFEQGAQGWRSTNGVEADQAAALYGSDNSGHGEHVSELDTDRNTVIYQDIEKLSEGEGILLSFDFAKRYHESITDDEGIEVIWNGNVVFSTSGDDTAWQQKTLKLTAQAGSNRIEFKGTGLNDGLGYILDNVVAKPEKLVGASAVSDNAQQNKAAANAQNDKEKAEADAQRLQQEKDQQLAAVSGSQKQLEASDQEALKTNGQAESEALAAEQKEITGELTDMTKGLDALDSHSNYQGKSGDSWRDSFAGGILDNVQSKLDDAKSNSQDKLEQANKQNKQNQQDVQSAVGKSESGVAKGKENQANSQQDINDAKAKAKSREAEASVKQHEAQQAESAAYAEGNKAQRRGEQDSSSAQSKSLQAQANAEGAKQDKDDKPDRDGASGSGLSGKAYEAQAADENSSHVNAQMQAADGRFSKGLTDDEQEALEGATQAIIRLGYKGGSKSANNHSGTTIAGMFSKADTDSSQLPKTSDSHEISSKEQQISGVNLQGLGEAVADAKKLISVDQLIEQAYVKGKIRGESYQKVIDALTDYHAVVQDRAGNEADTLKKLVNLSKQLEGYVLGHPDSGRVPALKSLLSEVHTRIDARVEDALLFAQSDVDGIKGKLRSRQYQDVTDALNGYQADLLRDGSTSDEMKAVNGLVDFCIKITGAPEGMSLENRVNKYVQLDDFYDFRDTVEKYVSDHPNSDYTPALNEILGQIDTWFDDPDAVDSSSYKKVNAALVDYCALDDDIYAVTDLIDIFDGLAQDSEIEPFDKLVEQAGSTKKMHALLKDVEHYIGTHPDSANSPMLKQLTSQVKTWIDERAVRELSGKIAQDSGFTRLYDKLDNANIKDSTHLYVDEHGDWVSGRNENSELALEKLKTAVSNEYGQSVADAVFSNLHANELAKDGKGIDVAGLKKVHQRIEQQLSPVSATLFIWKPSDHSSLGHAAMQIGQGRVQVDAQDAPDFNKKNYVSWWPLGSKSSKITKLFDIATPEHPELKIRKRDFSQPANQNETLEHDMNSEEKDNFGMKDGDRRLERFVEKLNAVKGTDPQFKDVSEELAETLLMNPHLLDEAGLPEHIYQPFVDMMNDLSYSPDEVAKSFVAELNKQVQANPTPEVMEKRITNVVRQFAERALADIENFKTQQADQGRVFRINLEGLDVAAMQAEWNKISNDPDARYQLLTKNCSSTVAKVLKAGGADKLIGHTWTPNVGIWTPTALFKYAQALQEAQLEIAADNQRRKIVIDHSKLTDKDLPVETAVLENDDVAGKDKEQKNYQSRDLVLEPIKNQETIELGMPEADQRVLSDIADRENVIIAVRPVDEKSKSLIESKMYSSKGLFVKAKSSDWGPMSGFIPVEQSFAKGSARRDLAKFNAYAQQSISTGNAVSADLYLNDVRVNELVSKYHSLTSLELDADSGMYKTTATNGEQSTDFFLKKVTVDGKELWQVNYLKDGEMTAFKVIGDPVSKQPMTADYDLLTVMHSYGDLGPKDKVKQPLTWEQWKDSVTYEDLSLKQKALYDSEALYTKKDGASLGIVSDRLKELKDVINTGLGRNNGLEMVHHGADDANPYAVMADNFPATFFVPKSFFSEDGLGEGKGSIQTYFNVNEQGAVVIRDPQEFSNFQQVAINADYRAAMNDKWNAGLDKPLFTKEEKLSHKFLDARDELANKLNADTSISDADKQLDSLGKEKSIVKESAEPITENDTKEIKYTQSYIDDLFNYVAEAAPEGSTNRQDNYERLRTTYSSEEIANKFEKLRGEARSHMITSMYSGTDNPFIKKAMSKASAARSHGIANCDETTSLVVEKFLKDNKTGFAIVGVDTWDKELPKNKINNGHVFIIAGLTERPSITAEITYGDTDFAGTDFDRLNISANSGAFIIDPWAKQSYSLDDPEWKNKLSAIYDQAYEADIIAEGKSTLSLKESNRIVANINIYVDKEGLSSDKSIGTMLDLKEKSDAKRHFTDPVINKIYSDDFIDNQKVNFMAYHSRYQNEASIVLLEDIHTQVAAGQNGIDLLNKINRTNAGQAVLNELHSSGKKLVISFGDKKEFFSQYTNSQGEIVENVAHLVLSKSDFNTSPQTAAAAIAGSAAMVTNAQFDVNEFERQFAKQKLTLKPIVSITKESGYFDFNFDNVSAVSELKKQAAVTGKRIGTSYQNILDKLAQFHDTSPVGKRVIAQELDTAIRQYVAEHPSSGRNSALLHLQQTLKNGQSLLDELSDSKSQVKNRNVESWDKVTVTAQNDGGETRFDGQLIIQTENDPAAAKAAANLAGKHPESSVVVQLDADGKYRVVYGEPSKLSGKLRWQVVGHGRDESENNNTRISGYSATELAAKLAKFNQDFSAAENISSKPEHISIVGCSLVSTDKQKGFAQGFISEMAENGIRSDVSARSSEVAVDATGRKHTRDADQQWAKKQADNKVVLSWDEQEEVTVREEAVRNGIAEGDIDISRIGQSDNDGKVRGAIADNDDVFTAPEKRNKKAESSSSGDSDNKVSYSGNIQVQVGDGEFTAVNWGTSNLGIKVGTGGFKSLAFGDNNVMVHIGNGDSKHSFDMGGYQALEGAQMFIGNRNVSFNMGRSNDLIVMMDKSVPTPPLVNPFDGAARISGVLQGIAGSGDAPDWLAAQDKQWTLAGAKKFVTDMSGLDQTSSVDYTTLVDLDSQHERSSRGLKSDTEATLNKKYNEWLSGNKKPDTSKMSRADKLRQKNEELAFNLAVGGRGADIQVTTGNWNFMFGDNIQSILDTNLGSLFGLMTQEFSLSGKPGTTFTYNPQDLPRQLKNKLLGKLAGVGADTTLADIFAVDYTANGHIVSRSGEAVDGVAILTEMLEVVAEFGGEQLKSFTDPSKLLDSLKSSLDMGKDAINSFAESHGLKDKAPEEQEEQATVSVNGETDSQVKPAEGSETASQTKPAEGSETAEKEERAFGFNALNLPNLFATIFSTDKQSEMKSLVTNLKENLSADLLNMKEKTFDFLRNSGHLQGDGDLNVSLGNYNFNWGGDGKDLGAYLGDNNNFWGGRGDDVYYATGTSNIFTGGEDNDMGVLMGRENMMFGGKGDDTAVVAGRINNVFMGDGNDQAFVFGEGGTIEAGSGQDYVVTSGNYNVVQAGDDQDYVVTIGNNNQICLGDGDDFANVFGNYNKIDGKAGKDVIKLMGYHAVVNGGVEDDHLIAASISKYSEFDGGAGNDLLVLGGYSNTFQGGAGIDSFMVSGDVIDNQVTDIAKDDFIVFNQVNWDDLWLQRSGADLQIQVNRKAGYSSDQAKFESIGSVTFSDYFADNRAELVISMDAKQGSGERDYIALSNDAVDNLVQAMSGFAPSTGDAGFIDPLDSSMKLDIALAWGNVNKGTGHIA